MEEKSSKSPPPEEETRKPERRKRRLPENGLLPGRPVYVFAVDGEQLASFADIRSFSSSEFYRRWFGAKAVEWIRRAGRRTQPCYRGKLFITHEADFVPSLNCGNHNPLSANNIRSIPPAYIYDGWKNPSCREGAWRTGKQKWSPMDMPLHTVADHLADFDAADLTESQTLDLAELHEAFSGEGFEENALAHCSSADRPVGIPTFWNGVSAFLERASSVLGTERNSHLKIIGWLIHRVNCWEQNHLMTFAAATMGDDEIKESYTMMLEDSPAWDVFPKYYGEETAAILTSLRIYGP
jgi:hypothetical protein